MKTTLLTTLVTVLACSNVMADDDISPAQAKQLEEQGIIKPLSVLQAQALKTKPGNIIRSELEKDHERYEYEFTIIDAQKAYWELEVNAQTGQVTKMELDD
ncbi:PepSY domain-containing protein [Zooshikella sp. RANM57]|uniref:PepSY domain-containing protein n=1 Tax=Zooshikella sp. RANM57 TaxID=3425863 RepID=UPI003D6F4880